MVDMVTLLTGDVASGSTSDCHVLAGSGDLALQPNKRIYIMYTPYFTQDALTQVPAWPIHPLWGSSQLA